MNPEKTATSIEALRDLVRRWTHQGEIDARCAGKGLMTAENELSAWVWFQAAAQLAEHLPPELETSTANLKRGSATPGA